MLVINRDNKSLFNNIYENGMRTCPKCLNNNYGFFDVDEEGPYSDIYDLNVDTLTLWKYAKIRSAEIVVMCLSCKDYKKKSSEIRYNRRCQNG